VSVRGFQQALCDLIASPQLCLQVRVDPDGALAGYDLSERDRRRLKAVSLQPGMSVNCTLYRVNRITPLYSMLPRSCLLLGDGLSEHASAFWDSQATDMQFGPEIERFAEFLRGRVADGAVRSPYLLEVLDFELAVNALRFAPRQRLIAELEERQAGDRWELHPLLRVVPFAHDPSALLAALAQGGAPPDELEHGDFHLLLDATGPELELRSIDPRLGRALERVAREPSLQVDDCAELPALIDARLVVPAQRS
jgi:hypothetical protein